MPGGQAPYRVFVSAVSRELGAERFDVARVLRRKGLHVDVQDMAFRQGPGTLLAKLTATIDLCDAVVCLVGETEGAGPSAEAVASIECPTYARYLRESGQTDASYTQWELLLALDAGCDFYLSFTPDDDAAPDSRQLAFRRWLFSQGQDYQRITSREQLIEDVLVLDLPTLALTKPQNLPYPSLGDLFKGRESFLGTLRNRLVRP